MFIKFQITNNFNIYSNLLLIVNRKIIEFSILWIQMYVVCLKWICVNFSPSITVPVLIHMRSNSFKLDVLSKI